MPPSMRTGNLIVCPKLGSLSEERRKQGEYFFKTLRDAYHNRVAPWFASVLLALPITIVASIPVQELSFVQKMGSAWPIALTVLCWLVSVLFLKLIYYNPRYRSCIENLSSMLNESPFLIDLLKRPYVIPDEEKRLRRFLKHAIALVHRRNQ